MIIDIDTRRSLAGKTWQEIFRNTLEIYSMEKPSSDDLAFCYRITNLMNYMEKHDYKITVEQAFMWLYIESYQYYVKRTNCVTSYSKLMELLVPADYTPTDGKKIHQCLYDLFNSKCLVSPTHGAVLWNTFLRTGTEKEAKPNINAYMIFPWLYKIMPVWYRQDISYTEKFAREAIFMALPCLLGNFCLS